MKTLLLVLLFILIVFLQSLYAQYQWDKYNQSVLDVGPAGAWDCSGVMIDCVLYEDTLYKMYYTGFNNDQSAIGLAISSDGMHWVKDINNPILTPDIISGQYTIKDACVLKFPSEYRMWYTTFINHLAVGYAVSLDGIADWNKGQEHVFQDGVSPCVLLLNGKYQMWFTKYNNDSIGQIGSAESSDGICWTITSDNILPVIKNNWDSYSVSLPDIVYNGKYYEMFYSGKGSKDDILKCGYAYSYDAISWNKDVDKPILEPTSGTWDEQGILTGEVLYFKTPYSAYYQLWYSGFDGTTWRIGYAKSNKATDILESNNAPAAFTLYNNYPNPFNPSTVIKYSLPSSADVKITVTDILGNVIKEYLLTNQNSGENNLRFDADGLASGVYLYSVNYMAANNTIKSAYGKMLLLK